MNTRWSMEEENLLADMLIEVNEDRENYNERSFWNQVVERFNNQFDGVHRNKHMITKKWSRLSCECQKFNDIYKHLQRTSQDNNRLHNVMNIFKERYGGRGFQYVHAWFILRNNPVWDRRND